MTIFGKILSAVFRMISVDFISAFRPLKEIGALMTIIGSYKKIIRKFDRQTRSCPKFMQPSAKTIKKF
jgi:hypothetical protein